MNACTACRWVTTTQGFDCSVTNAFSSDEFIRCGHPNLARGPNPVNGKPRDPLFCNTARLDGFSECGAAGKLFEPKLRPCDNPDGHHMHQIVDVQRCCHCGGVK